MIIISFIGVTEAMTELLERAIARLKSLPASQQDTIAAMIVEEP